jgi:hypothetical protein
MAQTTRATARAAGSTAFLSRLGWRGETLAIAILVVIAASLAAHTLLVSLTAPSAYASRYVQAMARGDASAAWGSLRVAAPGSADATLLSRQSLAAMLELPANRQPISDVEAAEMGPSGAGVAVRVSYREAQAVRHRDLTLLPDRLQMAYFFLPHWRVVVTPVVLQLLVPDGGGTLSLDGQTLPAAVKTVAVFPGSHVIQIGGSRLFAPATQAFATGLSPTAVRAPLELTAAARSQAIASLKTAIQACAQATALQPPGCPQRVADVASGPARWQLYGDPAASLVFSTNDSDQLVADGRFQMSVSYASKSPIRNRLRAVAGLYEASFGVAGEELTVKTVAPTTTAIPAVPRPSIAESDVVGSVKAAFGACAATALPSPPGCPQSVSTLTTPTNFQWHLDADPSAGAAVAWDGDQAEYRVSGSYSMTATYDETFPYEPTFHRTESSSGTYVADLFWDGSKAAFVAFE